MTTTPTATTRGAAGAPVRPAGPQAVRDAMTMLGRQLRHAKRYPELTVILVAMPLVFLLLFVYVFGGTLGAGLAPGAGPLAGGRAEYAFSAAPPRHGAEAAAADDFALQTVLHLAALNDRVLLTPFHNMALMAPTTTDEQVDRHTASFHRTLAALAG